MLIVAIRTTFCSSTSCGIGSPTAITDGCEELRSHGRVRIVHTGLQHASTPRRQTPKKACLVYMLRSDLKRMLHCRRQCGIPLLCADDQCTAFQLLHRSTSERRLVADGPDFSLTVSGLRDSTSDQCQPCFCLRWDLVALGHLRVRVCVCDGVEHVVFYVPSDEIWAFSLCLTL